MIQNQLVDYISAQIKLGVSRDTIKNTLVSAGWVAGDVEDTLKKVESQSGPQSAGAMSLGSSPASASSATPSSPASPASAVGPVGSGPQILKVSDLVSGSGASPSVTPPAMASSPIKDISPRSPLTGPAAASPASTMTRTSTTVTTASMEYPQKSPMSRAAIVVDVVLIIILLVVGGFTGFLYMQNHTLSGQLTTLQTQSTGADSQVSTLQSQLTASTTALAAQVSSISAENQELQNELSFYAVSSSTTPATTTPVTVNGLVSGGGRALYVITAAYGAKIYVANSKDASVTAALAPLVGITTTQQFAGTYVPGSDSFTVTTANGTTVQ